MLKTLDSIVFLFSSFKPLPDHYFQGYCYIGTDLVVSAPGAEQYRAEFGSKIEPGNDGCYLSIEKYPFGHEIGADHGGYTKIFYYCTNGIWAFSNSLVLLSEHLVENHVNLSRNEALLSQWYVNSIFGVQLGTFETGYNEIKLLPSYCTIQVSSNAFKIKHRKLSPQYEYEEALGSFINIWLSRTATILLSNDTQSWCQITGGRDSRITLALFIRTAQLLGLDLDELVQFRSHEFQSFESDFRAASNLAKSYDFNLNKTYPTQPRISSVTSYQQWRFLNLGVYSPIRFHPRALTPHHITFTGLSGECLRYCYTTDRPEVFVSSVAKKIHHPLHRDTWSKTVLDTIDEISSHYSGYSTNPLFTHFREFRNRIHFATGPQQALIVTPLNSAYLHQCVQASSEEKIATGQITYDLIENLSPGLSQHNYDSRGKLPTEYNLENLTRVSCTLSTSPGKIYKGKELPVSSCNEHDRISSTLKLLSQELERSMSVLPLDFTSPGYRNSAMDNMNVALERNKLTPKLGIPISHIISSAQVHNLTN